MNRGVLVHGVLLLCALLVGFQTLRDGDDSGPEMGDVSIWSVPEASIRALTYSAGDERVRIERRGEAGEVYLWGVERRRARAERGPDKLGDDGHSHGQHDLGGDDGHEHDYAHDFEDRDASSDGADAGPGAAGADAGAETVGEAEAETAPEDGASSAEAETAAEDEDEDGAEGELETIEYPVGSAGEELFERYAELTAVRDLGVPGDDQRAQYESDERPDAKIAVHLEDGSTRVVRVGAAVFGGSDRYLFDDETGRAYVVRSQLVRPLRGGQSSLRLRELHEFEAGDVERIDVAARGADGQLVRAGGKPPASAAPHGSAASERLGDARWARADRPGEPDQTLANFIGRVEALRPIGYAPDVETSALERLVALDFRGGDGEVIGRLELFRKPSDGDDGRPTYYVRSERTRVLGEVSPLAAERVEQDLAPLFAGDAPASPESGDGELPPAGAGEREN